MADLKTVLRGIFEAVNEATDALHAEQRASLEDLETSQPIKMLGIEMPAVLLAPSEIPELDLADFRFAVKVGPFWNKSKIRVHLRFKSIGQHECANRVKDAGNADLDKTIAARRLNG